jgi:hypothetical protein
MSRLRLPLYALFAATVLGGCTTLPSGPSVAVMPAPNKPFEVFEHDDLVCREYASRRIGVDPATQEQGQIATGAIAGAAMGAVVGGVVSGGDSEDIAQGAGVGMVAGTAMGADRASQDSYRLQERYDIAYMQCMYAKGNQVPGYPTISGAPPPPPPRR